MLVSRGKMSSSHESVPHPGPEGSTAMSGHPVSRTLGPPGGPKGQSSLLSLGSEPGGQTWSPARLHPAPSPTAVAAIAAHVRSFPPRLRLGWRDPSRAIFGPAAIRPMVHVGGHKVDGLR